MDKTLKKRLRLAIIIVVSLFCLAIAIDKIAKIAVENSVRMITGLELKTRSVHIGLATSRIKVRGLHLLNPSASDFETETMMKMPELLIHYDLSALIRKELHLKKLTLHLEELTLIKNADGATNLSALTGLSKPSKKKEASKKESKELPTLQIDDLHLQIGSLHYLHFSSDGDASVNTFDIGLDEHYYNISGAYKLTALIVGKALLATTIGQIPGLDMGAVQSIANEKLNVSKDFAKKQMQAAKEQSSKLLKTSGDSLKSQADQLKQRLNKLTAT